jgi:hypothetical protein
MKRVGVYVNFSGIVVSPERATAPERGRLPLVLLPLSLAGDNERTIRFCIHEEQVGEFVKVVCDCEFKNRLDIEHIGTVG